MGIRKFKADYLFTGHELLFPDAVLVTDDQGTVKGIVHLKDAGEGVEIFEGLITPGFVNTHCHLELSHMKARIEPGSGLINFLVRVIKERNFNTEEIHDAMQLAETEMYENGIVAVGDICNTTHSIGVKQNSKIKWFNFIEAAGFNEDSAQSRMDYATTVLQAFMKLKDNQTLFSDCSVVPHAPYSVSKELFRLVNESSRGKIISIHNQESEAENNLYRNKSGELFTLYSNLGIDAGPFEPSGKTSLQTYLPWLNRAAAIILVHDAFTGKEDLLFIEDNHSSMLIYFCLCINANRYIQSINPPVDLLRKRNCIITLGTDSMASNHQLNILEEIKTIHRQFPHITLPEILQWATLNGAKALGMDAALGSFDKGKQPGVVLISHLDNVHVTDRSRSVRLI